MRLSISLYTFITINASLIRITEIRIRSNCTYNKIETLIHKIIILQIASIQQLEMQTSTGSPGYQFLQNIYSKHLNCKQCLQLMVQPVRLHPCGHTFCSHCLSAPKKRQCPLCTSRIQAQQKDILAAKLVGELMVRCVQDGCPWKGSLEEFENYHRGGCRLREGGLDAWLNSLKTMIGQHTVGDQEQKQEKQATEQHLKVELRQKNIQDKQQQKQGVPTKQKNKDQNESPNIQKPQKSSSKKNKRQKKSSYSPKKILKPTLIFDINFY